MNKKEEEIETKVCRTCGRELPITEFMVARKNRGGHDLDCKECRRMKKRTPYPWELIY